MINIIVAINKNLAIGKDNNLLWHIPEDLKRFKSLTKNNIVIMGRKTYESISKPLPKRVNIIITRNPSFQAPWCIITNSLDDAIKEWKKYTQKEIYIIWWWEIYRQALDIADRLDITEVNEEYEADTFFPEFRSDFKEISRDHREWYDFVTYEKNKK